MEMKLKTSLMKGLVSSLINKSLNKKFKTNLKLSISEFEIVNEGEDLILHMKNDVRISQKDLMKLLNIGE